MSDNIKNEEGKITAFDELPEEVAIFLSKKNLSIKLKKIDLESFVDQSTALRSSDGCWSAPGGPHC